MSILILAEHDNQTLKTATRHAVTAAAALGGDVTLLIAGHNCGPVAQAAQQVQGVDRVVVADAACYAHQLAENVAPLVAELAESYSHILAPATTTGKNLIPRVAALLDVQPLSEVLAIESGDTFLRPIYAGNIVARVQSSDPIKLMTIRTTTFAAAEATGNSCPIEALASQHDTGLSRFVSQELTPADRVDLTAARVVVSGGRALQSAENFDLLYKLADKLDAAVGASRAAVDAGYVANDLQVGQTGKIVSPELYVAVGISGAIQHIAGIKDSKIIVAINKDPEAPIFKVADYGLVADLFEAVPELEKRLAETAVEERLTA